ncbi:TPA: DUF922 domain-containing protein [Vibrio cholerae]|nr:DUF922 domain-containing protein [Vibrio cholerae]HEQ3516820.1 DUF922 domain-containing protein [Vibrio cholerae]HEQ3579855.1 DUF922 domain-containing protein [Vibrio cholerae]
MSKVLLVATYLIFVGQVFASSDLGFPFQKQIEIYLVGGANVDEVNLSFDANKPNVLEAKGFDAYTSWKYDFYTNDDTCEIYEFNLGVKYTLPRIDSLSTSKEVSEEFRTYLEQLYRHEQVHCALVAKFMHEAFLTFKEGQNGECSIANQKVTKLESEFEENNALFDVYTSHGKIELAESPFGEENYLDMCKIPIEPIPPRI